jgi:hypothetical protein
MKERIYVRGSVVSTPIWGSKMRLLRHFGHLDGRVSRSSPKLNPQERHRAGITTMR